MSYSVTPNVMSHYVVREEQDVSALCTAKPCTIGGAISVLDPYSQRDPVCNSLFCIPTVF